MNKVKFYAIKSKLLLCFCSVALLCFVLPACSSKESVEPEIVKEEINVKLDYALMSSGSMSRAGEDIYADFFEGCINNKLLAPQNYELTFKNNEGTGWAIKEVNGKWGENEGVRLVEGTYTVEGATSPKYIPYTPKFAGDSIWLSFDERIEIKPDTKKLVLSAKYECFLLLFDADNISSIDAYYYYSNNSKHSLQKYKNIYYLFVNKNCETDYNRDSWLMLKITRPSGTSIILNLGNMSFENGKYYYFNDVTNSFDLEPMEQGN